MSPASLGQRGNGRTVILSGTTRYVRGGARIDCRPQYMTTPDVATRIHYCRSDPGTIQAADSPGTPRFDRIGRLDERLDVVEMAGVHGEYRVRLLPGVRAGGLRGQMYKIGVQSDNRISVFFRPTPALGRPPIRRAGRRRRRIFLAANHLGPDARLTSVGIDEENAPLARDVANHFAGHYLAQCPNRATPSGTVRQSARNFWNVVRFRRACFGTMCFSSGRFPAQCRFCGAISGTMSIARDYKSDKVNFETRFRRDLRPKRKTICASEPLARPPSSVETPVCRPMRRTPSAAAHACWEAGGGGLVVVQETT